MSLTRWTATTAAMAAAAWALVVLGPDGGQAWRAVSAPQALVDVAGADALLVPVAAAAGWVCWAWGALGLVLTALCTVPGAVGRAADVLVVALLPAGARRLAAVAVGLTVAGPLLAPPTPLLPVSVARTTAALTVAEPATAGHVSPIAVTGTSVADWPAAPAEGPGPAEDDAAAGGVPPDWPGPPVATPAADERVVLRGDCLWDIAADWLTGQRPGVPAGDTDVLAAVHAWWQANAAVIGPDPDLLLPGQVLSAPMPDLPR